MVFLVLQFQKEMVNEGADQVNLRVGAQITHLRLHRLPLHRLDRASPRLAVLA
jgi:hypothetical protein